MPGFIVTFTSPSAAKSEPPHAVTARPPRPPRHRSRHRRAIDALWAAARVFCLVHLGLTAMAEPAFADAEHPVVAEARHRLERYDLEGSATTDVLAELGHFDRTAYLNELRRVSFLRGAAAADLLLLAHLENLPTLTRRVADAYGVDEDRIVAHVRSELVAVRRGVYAPIVDDAVGALDRMAGLRGQRPVGPRSDAFFVHDVLAAAQSDDPESALAHLTSREVDLPFDRLGRRAIGAVEEAFAALTRLEDAAAHGDPFAAQLSDDLSARSIALRAIALEPLPAFDDSLGLGRFEQGTAVRPDLVLSVHPTEVRFAFVPRVTFAEGTPAMTGDQQPTFPAMATVPLDGLSAWPRPVDALVEALRSRVDGDTVIALGGAPDAQAHLLTRVWQSAARAGSEPRWLVARGANGLLAGIPARASRETDEATEVFVRLGGHSVSRRGQRSTTIPRERTETGWRHDWQGLVRAVSGPTALRYMGVVSLQTLMETAFVVGEEVTLDFP